MPENVQQALDTIIRDRLRTAATAPQARLPEAVVQPRWTLKRLVGWVKMTFGIACCRDTLRKTLKGLGFSWKKARKLLNKANPLKRVAFLEQLQGLLDEALHQRSLLVYIDEAHIHLDTDEGYGWSVKGERFWISSSSPGLKKVSFYGLYIYDEAQVRIWPYEVANQTTSIDVLERLRAAFPTLPIKLIWDGAPYHRALLVRDAAQTLDIELCPLPAYSPDFMPVEHLWQWLREDLTYHTCYDRSDDLIAQVKGFQARLNQDPLALSQRLWVTTQLDPEIEKLRFST